MSLFNKLNYASFFIIFHGWAEGQVALHVFFDPFAVQGHRRTAEGRSISWLSKSWDIFWCFRSICGNGFTSFFVERPQFCIFQMEIQSRSGDTDIDSLKNSCGYAKHALLGLLPK